MARIQIWYGNHPSIGIITSICSVIAVPLAIYLFFISFSYPDITFMVDRNRRILVSPEINASPIGVTYQGKPIEGESVGVSTVSIWNRGQRPVQTKDVLQQLEISIDNCKILDAKIVRNSRDICRFRANVINDSVRVEFDIIEKNDGVMIDVYYIGKLDSKVTVSGIVIGQDRFNEVKHRLATRHNEDSLFQIYLALTGAVVSTFVLIFIQFLRRFHFEKEHKRRRSILFKLVMTCIMAIAYGIMPLIVYFSNPTSPPF